MKLLALVPSKARALRLEAMTGSWLFNSGVDYKILVEPQDQKSYEKFHNVLLLPENDKGLDYSLYHGKQYAVENGYDVIFKIDDDVAGWFPTYDKRDLHNYGSANEKQRNETQRFQIILKDVSEPLEHPEIGGISFPYRFEHWHNKTWQAVNWRFQTCYVVKTEFFNPDPESGYIGSAWQDFRDFLVLRKLGKNVLRYGRYAMDTDVAQGEGGFGQMYNGRTPEQYKEMIEKFRKEFPLLKWRLKKNGKIEPDMGSPFIQGKEL